MKNKLKDLFPFLLLYLAAMVFFLSFLVTSAAVPETQRMHKNLRRSAELLYREGNYPLVGHVQLDNYTDALILNLAVCLDAGTSPFTSPFYGFNVPGEDKVEILRKLARNPSSPAELSDYARYWHGAAAFWRLVLNVLDLHHIRALLGAVMFGMAFLVFALILKRIDGWTAFCFLLILVFCNYYVFSISLQFTPAMFLALLGTCLMLRKPAAALHSQFLILFGIGLCCPYIDFLTAPLLSWGIPALVLFTLQDRKTDLTLSRAVRISAGTALIWGAGYVLSWGSKFLTAAVLLPGALQDIVAAIRQRASCPSPRPDYNRLNTLSENFQHLFLNNNRVVFCLAAAGIILLALTAFILLMRKQAKLRLPTLTGYLLIALVPVAVTLLNANHSFYHCWFTYRNLAVTVGALFLQWRAIAICKGYPLPGFLKPGTEPNKEENDAC